MTGPQLLARATGNHGQPLGAQPLDLGGRRGRDGGALAEKAGAAAPARLTERRALHALARHGLDVVRGLGEGHAARSREGDHRRAQRVLALGLEGHDPGEDLALVERPAEVQMGDVGTPGGGHTGLTMSAAALVTPATRTRGSTPSSRDASSSGCTSRSPARDAAAATDARVAGGARRNEARPRT
jgi:hypothetical protein